MGKDNYKRIPVDREAYRIIQQVKLYLAATHAGQISNSMVIKYLYERAMANGTGKGLGTDKQSSVRAHIHLYSASKASKTDG